MKTVYRSANGDDWLLAADTAGNATVIHRANLSSGGKETTLPVDEFLSRGGGSPEAQAVRAALDSKVAGEDSDVDETSAGGLNYPKIAERPLPTATSQPDCNPKACRHSPTTGEEVAMNAIAPEIRACIDECLNCYRTCTATSSVHCFPAGGIHVDPTHFRLLLACAEICRASAQIMLLGLVSEHKHTCRACAELCTACASSCDAVGDMADCVEACRRCAESCRRVAA